MPNTIGLRRGGPGRPKGSPNKVTPEVRLAARAIVDDPSYRKGLKTRVETGKAPHMEPLLWHYAHGKPADTVELQGRVDVVTRVVHQHLPADPPVKALQP